MRIPVLVLVLATALVGCGGQATRTGGPSATSDGSDRVSAVPQRPLRIVIRDEPTMFSERLDRNGLGFPVTVSLTYRDSKDALLPLLAERVPSQTDGSWIVNPDGTMKTTYALRPGLRWQDGLPLDAADFTFAHTVYLDRDVPVTTRIPETEMRAVIARDPRTLEIEWSSPYIWANALMAPDLVPLPRHLLEGLYTTDKTAFANASFWTSDEFVGNGPYRVARWEKGIVITVTANPHFVLGRPKIETIEFRFVTDANTTVAGFLAGTLDFGEYTAVNVEHAVILRDQWVAPGAGRIYSDAIWGVRYLEWQFRDVKDHQRAITDVRVRRALMHALDREELANALQYGFGPAADSGVPKTASISSRVDRAISKYPYDVRRAETLLAEAGWGRAPDGLLRDGSGRQLDVELRVTSERQQEQAIIADHWKRAGVNSSLFVVPRALINDQEYRVSYPAAAISAASHNRDFVTAVNVMSEQAPTAQNRYTGKNRGTYMNPELDWLYSRYLQTLDEGQRDDLVVDIERVMAAELALGTLYYIPQVAGARAGLGGIEPPVRGRYNWNLWEWEWLT